MSCTDCGKPPICEFDRNAMYLHVDFACVNEILPLKLFDDAFKKSITIMSNQT